MALYVKVNRVETSRTYNSANNGFDIRGNIDFAVYDNATDQPADGNGLQVHYTELENDYAHGQYTVTINERSKSVYTDVLIQATGYQSYYLSVSIDEYVQPDGVVGPGGKLSISDVLILLPAHIAGGVGVVLIKAGSDDVHSLQYFIDDIPVNPRFSGLTAGTHVAKVVDGVSGAQASLTFNMPSDEELLIGTPNKPIAPGINSRWHAAFNPLVFTYQRRDFRVTDVQNDNGFARIHTLEAVTGLERNNQVYLNAGPYQGVFDVRNATDTTITLNTSFTQAATGFLNSDTLRPYYKLVSRLIYTDPDTGSQRQSEYRHSPNPRNGLIEADYSGILRSLVTPQSDSNYDQANYNDPHLCAAYSVSYREEWEGSPQDRWFGINGNFYVTYSAMQVQSAYGSNMGQYVPCHQGSAARFVTDFKEPAYTPGYPFDIGFIYSELMDDVPYHLHITQLDVNRYAMGDPIIQRLDKKVGLNRLLLSQNIYHQNCWYLLIKVYGDHNGPVQVTENKVIRIDRAIDVNSVYVRWIGYAGSWEYYRFVWNQEMSLNVQNAVTVKRYVHDYQNTEGAEDTISKEAATGIKVFAEDLSVADIRGLQSLKTSPKVQWLASRELNKWQTVMVATGSAVEYETQLGTYAYQLQFTLPGVVVQTL